VLVDEAGPVSLTLAWDPLHTPTPSRLAERLPKALIHRNVAGERIHDVLAAADRAWSHAAPMAPFGPRQRWRTALALLADQGVPVAQPRRRLRDCVLHLPWSAVAPHTRDTRTPAINSQISGSM
jgi:hypothetical protein